MGRSRSNPGHRFVVLVVLMGLLSAGLAALSARPGGQEAAADPTEARELVGFGSPTAKGVMNWLSANLLLDNTKVLGSYDPTGTVPFTTTPPGGSTQCSYYDRLGNDRAAVRKIALASSTDACYAYARVGTKLEPDGSWEPDNLTFLPYAKDSVSFAISNVSLLPRRLTYAQVRQIFTCTWPGSVEPRLPPYGSALRTVWLAYLGITEAQAAGLSCIVTMGSTQGELTENDGRAFNSKTIAPYSLGALLGQRRGVDSDVSTRVVIGTLTDATDPAPVLANTDQYPDDVTYAISTVSQVPKTLTEELLRGLYTCTWANGALSPYLPASGPVRSAWLARLEIDETEMTNGAYPCVKTTRDDGTTIAENDGRGLTSKMVIPFSLTSFVDQELGRAPDLRSSTYLGSIGASSTAPGPTVINDAYDSRLVHRIYNVVNNDRLGRSPANEVFSGPNSLLCQLTPQIRRSGFLPIPEDDPEPCGTSVSPTLPSGFEAVSRSIANSPRLALDDGRVAGSGSQYRVRSGKCALEVRFNNAGNGSKATISTTATGPSCRVVIVARWYKHATHSASTETKVVNTSGPTDVNMVHTPGVLAHRFRGQSWLNGDSLVNARFQIGTWGSGGGLANESFYTLNVSNEPGIDGIEMIDPGHAGTPRLAWRPSESNPDSYRVYRRNEYLANDEPWRQIGTVAPSTNPFFFDHDAAPLYRYAYRVTPVFGTMEAGGSATVRIQPGEPYRIKHIAALGDSYASGEGAGNYYDSCHRAPAAYGITLRDNADPLNLYRFATAGQARTTMIACTGAVTWNVLGCQHQDDGCVQGRMTDWEELEYGNGPPPGRHLNADIQVKMLRASNKAMPVDLVTLSIGGNDVGFSDVLEDCLRRVCDTAANETALRARVTASSFSARLVDTYEAVLAASGDADLKVIGYPRLFPVTGATNNCAAGATAKIIFAAKNWNLTPGEMTMLNDLGNLLNETIKVAVGKVTNGAPQFMDPRPLFAGHDMCSSDNWLNKLLVISEGLNMIMASAHPNGTGHAQIATWLADSFLGPV